MDNLSRAHRRRWQRIGALVWVCLIAALATAPVASAAVQPLSIRQIAEQGDTGIVGTVVGLTPHWNAAHTLIVTTVTLRVEHVLKDSTGRVSNQPDDPPTPYSFDIPGGEVDGLALGVSDVATFNVGDRVVLFLRDTDLRTVGGFQGRFWMERGRVYREDLAPMPLADFLRELVGVPGVRIPDALWAEAAAAPEEIGAALAAPSGGGHRKRRAGGGRRRSRHRWRCARI